MVHQEDRVLLGIKKRGFGMGKWNGFGGKVNEGETIEEATKRELFEEAEITVGNIEKLGLLEFSWAGKEGVLEVNIFKAVDFEGIPTETEEMRPEWFFIKDIPYDKMWADDKYWLPLFLERKKFSGKVLFDEQNAILEHTIN